MISSPAIMVAQLGARRHYAVPEIMEAAGMLEGVYTDLFVGAGLRSVLGVVPAGLRPTWLRRLAGRQNGGVPAAKVRCFPVLGAAYAMGRRLSGRGRELGAHLWAGRRMCRLAVESGLGEAAGVYTFNTAGLELLQAARRSGLRTISDQTIVPKRVEERLLRAEREKWPAWERPEKVDPALGAYREREEAEWAESDVVVCGSEFVRQGIADCGGPAARCVVVRTGLRAGGVRSAERTRHEGPLRVLTVGAVGLRKGSPYVWQTADALRDLCVFRMVGEVGVPRAVVGRVPPNVELAGPVARCDVAEHYQWADVFFLPSVCEGSAIACDEALAFGLPVVCTANAGSVVTDGEDGYVLAVGDVAGFVEKLASLARSDDLWRALSRGALAAAGRLSAEYGRRLVSAIRSLFG